jgi:CheY-like chemotaxis protein
VEDNPHVAEMYSYTLRKLASQLPGSAVEVHFASDGHQALQVAQERSIQLVITDLYMPVLDGFALVERLRSLEGTRDVPIVAISAGGPEARNRALDAGVDVFLRKPVRFVEVLETVKTLIGV